MWGTEEKMVTKEFAENVAERIRGMMAGEVTVKEVEKNNGIKRTGIVIKTNKSIYGRMLYLDEFRGMTEQETAERMIDVFERDRKPELIDCSILEDWEKVKNQVVFELVNKEKNKEMLKNTPHKEYIDFAIIFKILLEANGTEATGTVSKELMEHYGISTDDLMKEAVRNTPEMRPPMVKGGESMIGEMLGMQATKENELFWIITNERRRRGAAVILYEGVLEEMSEKIGTDLWLLPSSVDEWIALRVREGDRPEELRWIVNEVNDEGVERQDVLGEEIYRYDREAGEVRRWEP